MFTEMQFSARYVNTQLETINVIRMTYLINLAKIISFELSEIIMFSVIKIIFLPLIFFILVVTSGCNSSDNNDLAALQSAKTKWDSQSAQFYTIQSQISCFCLAEATVQMRISVSDNLVLSAFDTNSDEVISKQVQKGIITVDGLFSVIETAIADSISIEVIYNEVYGYPETAKIDVEQFTSDGGIHFTLSNLEIKESLLALDDITWMLESFDSIAGPQTVIENSNISLSFDMANMQLNGMGGCNNYSADFVLNDANNDMIISNIISTEMACGEPANIMQQEQSYFAMLEQIRFFTFHKATLNMVVGGDAGLNFVANQNSADEPKIENQSNDLASLQSAKTKWDSHSKQYYTIQSQRSCECQDEVSAQMEISILDNSVLSAFDMVSGEVISKEIQQGLSTVDSLFASIENAITNSVSIEVTYNEEYGYPETAKIDLKQLAVDGGLRITLSNLEMKNSLLAMDDVTWTLASFDSIAGQQPVIQNTNISLSIDTETMQLNGLSGCNTYHADFVMDDASHDLRISNIISTEMACDDPENIMQQAQNYLATLQQIQLFTFDTATLNMVVGGDAGLRFVAED
jgi:heat shock protein HslJ